MDTGVPTGGTTAPLFLECPGTVWPTWHAMNLFYLERYIWCLLSLRDNLKYMDGRTFKVYCDEHEKQRPGSELGLSESKWTLEGKFEGRT